MRRSSRARIGATATMSVLSLALITTAAAKALSAAELEKLLLAKGDVTGYEAADGDDTLPKAKGEVKTDKADCAPPAHAMAGLAPGDTDAGASNTLTKSPTATPSSEEEAVLDVEMTFVGLSSYDGDGDGAEKAVKAVADGIAACSGGFTITAQGEKQKITKVAAGKPSGKGDESVAFSVGSEMDGEGTATFNTEVVRAGNTVTSYCTVDFASLDSGKAAAVPTTLIDAQPAKLK
ncbi:hypothetical protein ABZT06_20120 [Streptomyces sp. NPDC005483]|uniref:hypothetical protein n=1 Tax=Streptomyces sp. NPDC005483 TaxID=3154882 RepID=UPI0033AF0860